MTDLSRDVVEYSLETFVAEVVALTKDGWVAVEGSANSNPFGNGFTVSMTRNDKTVRDFKEYVEAVASVPKLTREEILVKARAAKAANAKIDVTAITTN